MNHSNKDPTTSKRSDALPSQPAGFTGIKKWSSLVKKTILGHEPYDGAADDDDSLTCIIQVFIKRLRRPTVCTFAHFRRNLTSTEHSKWVLEFIQQNGVSELLDSLVKLCNKKEYHITDTLLLLECVGCIKAVMNSQNGLDEIIENKEFTRKLARALDTSNNATKKQLFELLSSLCYYSMDGYSRAIDALETYKNEKKTRHRFSILVDELNNAETLPYQGVLLAFINCIINQTETLEERIRIRNEFLGLKLLDVIRSLKVLNEREPDADVSVQIDVFEEKKSNDDDLSPAPHGVDINNCVDIFHSIFKQVVDTSFEIPFISILQNLLQIDQSDPMADIVWETVEKLVYRATLMEKGEKPEKIIQTGTRRLKKVVSGQCFCTCHNSASQERLHRVSIVSRPIRPLPPVPMDDDAPPPPLPPKRGSYASVRSPEPPPPPPPPSMPAPRPPPPPPPPPGCPPPPPPPPPPPVPGAPPPPPPPPGMSSPGKAPISIKLPQQDIPKPTRKMKLFQWNKIPSTKVMGKDNVWTLVASLFKGHKINFDKIEQLFCKSEPVKSTKKDTVDAHTEKKKSDVVHLLDGKRNLNINIFLKQFRLSNDDIIELIEEGESMDFGAEKLKGLMKLLPTSDEIDMLKSFDGSTEKLGNAEKFILQLIELPDYELKIEVMLTKEEYNQNMDYIKPTIDTVIIACRDLKESKDLKELFYLVLIAGNFLNSGGYAGDAAGFKMTSLLKLTEIRANKPKLTLLHYVILEAAEKNPELLKFPEKMKFLKDAAQASLESISCDIKSLEEKVKRISNQIAHVDETIRNKTKPFLCAAMEELHEIKLDLEEIDNLKTELAEFLCEDSSTFKLEECLSTFQSFVERFRKAIEENKQRKEQEEKAEQRRKQKELTMMNKTVNPNTDGNKSEPSNIIDRLLGDIRSGFTSHDTERPNSPMSVMTPSATETSSNDLVRFGLARNSGGKKGNIRLRSITEYEDGDKRPHSANIEDFGRKKEILSDRKIRGASVDDGDLLDMLCKGSDEKLGQVGKWEDVVIDKAGSISRRRRKDRKVDSFLELDRERPPTPGSPALLDLRRRSRSSVDSNDIDIAAMEDFDRYQSETYPQDYENLPSPRRDKMEHRKHASGEYNSCGSNRSSAEFTQSKSSGENTPTKRLSGEISTVPSSDPKAELLDERKRRRDRRSKLSMDQNMLLNIIDSASKTVDNDTIIKNCDTVGGTHENGKTITEKNTSLNVTAAAHSTEHIPVEEKTTVALCVNINDSNNQNLTKNDTDTNKVKLPNAIRKNSYSHKFGIQRKGSLEPHEIAYLVKQIEENYECGTNNKKEINESNKSIGTLSINSEQKENKDEIKSKFINQSENTTSAGEDINPDENTLKNIRKSRFVETRRKISPVTRPTSFEWRDKTDLLLTQITPDSPLSTPGTLETDSGVATATPSPQSENSIQTRFKNRWKNFVVKHDRLSKAPETNSNEPAESADDNSTGAIMRRNRNWRQKLALNYSCDEDSDENEIPPGDFDRNSRWRHTFSVGDKRKLLKCIKNDAENMSVANSKDQTDSELPLSMIDESDVAEENSNISTKSVTSQDSVITQISMAKRPTDLLGRNSTLITSPKITSSSSSAANSPERLPRSPSFDGNESLTEKALLEHTARAWRDGSDRSNSSSPERSLVNNSPVFSRRSPDAKNASTEIIPRKVSSDHKLNTRRWACYIADGDSMNLIGENRSTPASPATVRDISDDITDAVDLHNQRNRRCRSNIEGKDAITAIEAFAQKNPFDNNSNSYYSKEIPETGLVTGTNTTGVILRHSRKLGSSSEIVNVCDESVNIICEENNNTSHEESECDTGFETASQSDTISQRTSMSSTLESDLPMTPTTQRRKLMTPQKETAEELAEVSNQLTRSQELVDRMPENTAKSTGLAGEDDLGNLSEKEDNFRSEGCNANAKGSILQQKTTLASCEGPKSVSSRKSSVASSRSESSDSVATIKRATTKKNTPKKVTSNVECTKTVRSPVTRLITPMASSSTRNKSMNTQINDTRQTSRLARSASVSSSRTTNIHSSRTSTDSCDSTLPLRQRSIGGASSHSPKGTSFRSSVNSPRGSISTSNTSKGSGIPLERSTTPRTRLNPSRLSTKKTEVAQDKSSKIAVCLTTTSSPSSVTRGNITKARDKSLMKSGAVVVRSPKTHDVKSLYIGTNPTNFQRQVSSRSTFKADAVATRGEATYKPAAKQASVARNTTNSKPSSAIDVSISNTTKRPSRLGTNVAAEKNFLRKFGIIGRPKLETSSTSPSTMNSKNKF